MTGPKVCAIDECGRPAVARGWCHKHYKRFQTHGSPHIVTVRRTHINKGQPCAVEGCDRPASARRLCDAHYKRWRVSGDPRADVPIRRSRRPATGRRRRSPMA